MLLCSATSFRGEVGREWGLRGLYNIGRLDVRCGDKD